MVYEGNGKMRSRIIALSVLLIGQALSVIALVYFIPHLSRIWYSHELGWIEAIKAEYAQGGWVMIVEFVLIAVVIIGTITFEVWFLVSASKAERGLIKELSDIKEQMGNGFKKLSDQISKKGNGKTTKSK